MTKKKITFLSISALFILACTLFCSYWAWKVFGAPAAKHLPEVPAVRDYETIEERAKDALAFAKRHDMNTRYALFVDYSVPSGTPLLYVWDFTKNRIIARTYVMHGPGKGSTAEKPVFSSQFGSRCSSLGRFKVTKEHGNINKRGFRLQGMDIDNRTAYNRDLLIHRSPWVYAWCWKKYIPLNANSCQGCVTVSSRGMDYLWNLINSERKNLLLWNYNGKVG